VSTSQADVVVVGAGPAGLACANALSGLDVLVLEREPHHGGRIRTIALAGQAVDLGACFAFDSSLAPTQPATICGRLVRERAAIGMCDSGAMHFADTPLNGLKAMNLDDETRRRIEHFSRTAADAGAARGTRAYALLNALLHQIHPGELADYDAGHQRDGLYTWYPDHWESGNRALVDALLERSGAQLRCDARVCEISGLRGGVEVRYRSQGDDQRVACRAAVVATTADMAATLLPRAATRVRDLLDATRYAGYIVVALAGAASPALASFRSLVPAHQSPAVVMQQRSPDRGAATLLCYYCGPDADALAGATDADLVVLTRAKLSALGIEDKALAPLGASAVARWPLAATILSARYRHSRGRARAPTQDAVFLAGDYACADPGVGYGIADAVASGIDAARELRAYLGH
jgi:phytoene dehydrogenase-like protein